MLYSNFVGRIGKNGAKVIPGPKGKFVSMDVATDFYSKGENKTMWIRVRSNKENHVKLAEYLTKGKMILIQGQQLEDSTWIGKDGEAHSQHVIIADSIDFVRTGNTGSTGRKKEDAQNGQQGQQVESAPITPASDAPYPAPADNSDDLPF